MIFGILITSIFCLKKPVLLLFGKMVLPSALSMAGVIGTSCQVMKSVVFSRESWMTLWGINTRWSVDSGWIP